MLILEENVAIWNLTFPTAFLKIDFILLNELKKIYRTILIIHYTFWTTYYCKLGKGRENYVIKRFSLFPFWPNFSLPFVKNPKQNQLSPAFQIMRTNIWQPLFLQIGCRFLLWVLYDNHFNCPKPLSNLLSHPRLMQLKQLLGNRWTSVLSLI